MDKGKAIIGFLRSVAVGIAVSVGTTALDQTVRSLTNEYIKRRAQNKEANKK